MTPALKTTHRCDDEQDITSQGCNIEVGGGGGSIQRITPPPPPPTPRAFVLCFQLYGNQVPNHAGLQMPRYRELVGEGGVCPRLHWDIFWGGGEGGEGGRLTPGRGALSSYLTWYSIQICCVSDPASALSRVLPSGPIPPQLGSLTTLKEINLSENKLTGEGTVVLIFKARVIWCLIELKNVCLRQKERNPQTHTRTHVNERGRGKDHPA